VKMLIIADDLTGAADCGAAWAGYGIDTVVQLHKADEGLDNAAVVEKVEVLAIDTDTRCLDAEHAAERVAQLVGHYEDIGSGIDGVLLYKKLDSTLRGNVAAELAAALKVRRARTSSKERVVILLAPAFPAHGRTTVRGRQMMHGKFLEGIDFGKYERVSGRSNIVEIIGEAGLSSGIVELALVRSGAGSLESAIIRMAKQVDVLVCDAETDADLKAIASGAMVLGRRTVWAGSAGLARHIPIAFGFPDTPKSALGATFLRGPKLFVVGSPASASREQERALAAGSTIVPFTIPHSVLLNRQSRGWREYGRLISERLQSGDDVLVVLDCKDQCSREQGRLLTQSLATMTQPCVKSVGALVATGGETARAILDAWGINRLRLAGEVEPGLPYSITAGWDREILVLTKAGGFGTPGTLLHCREFLETLRRGAELFGVQSTLTDNQKR
jgi:D-threonate/D-erythronate kinase